MSFFNLFVFNLSVFLLALLTFRITGDFMEYSAPHLLALLGAAGLLLDLLQKLVNLFLVVRNLQHRVINA